MNDYHARKYETFKSAQDAMTVKFTEHSICSNLEICYS